VFEAVPTIRRPSPSRRVLAARRNPALSSTITQRKATIRR
jgi:hypothetical protein